MARRPRDGEGVGICDASGFKVPLGDLVKQWDGAYVDRRFVDKRRQPQDFIRGVPDDQRLPFARPETTDTFIDPGSVTGDDL